jgi:hypothetical protein
MPLFLPYLVARLGDTTGRMAILRTSAAIMAVTVSTAAVYPSVEERFDAADLLTLADCKKGDYSILQSVSPGRTIMPQGMTLTFLLHAPKDFSVPDIQFHRASAGMTRAFQAFLTHDSQVRKQMLLPFDYVAACKIPDGLVPADNTMFDALSHGRGWPGLELLTEPGSLFQLYRINHASLG